ncbi:hypothetical protein BOX15_Mlig013931g2 [Macrostomum lignano]|uniref:BHLH domain-containing protein n=1 Tax=Macrostomum lignano TaxID=282301 RepID=A0A267GGG1_9PLAT|nr:hypothetical protein BOX15_Mlig013931g2 [Macrostomum lignano]
MERMLQLLYGGQPEAAAANSAASSSSAAAAEASSAVPLLIAGGAAAAASDAESGRRIASGSGGSGRDPESHRIIEKRRRDRVNNALAELCCLVPSARAKQSQGRIEKAEIIEMAIQHIAVLTSLVGQYKTESGGHQIPALCAENFQQGFLDATRATLSFLSESESAQMSAGTADSLCAHLYAHLQGALQRYNSKFSDEDSEISALLDARKGLPPSELPLPPPQAPPSSSQPLSSSRITSGPEQAQPGESDSAGSEDHPDDAEDELQLPGFVLHPSGTHYLPMVLPRRALGKELLGREFSGVSENEADERGDPSGEVLHPVSIPVNFRSPRRVRIVAGRKRKLSPEKMRWGPRAESD